MKSYFRIAKGDTIKATMCVADGRLLASLYDSNFRTISGVISALLEKVPLGCNAKHFDICIVNVYKEQVKYLKVRNPNSL